MTPDKIDLVKDTWKRVNENSRPVAGLFYQKLFLLDPTLHNLFLNDLNNQHTKFHATLTTIVESLDRPVGVISKVHALGVSHAGYGVQDEHYSTVESALLWALQECLQDEFTADVEEAWQQAYRAIAESMIAADLDAEQHPL